MKFKKIGYDLRVDGFGITAPPIVTVVLALIFIGAFGAVLKFARPGSIDGFAITFMSALAVGFILYAALAIWRWCRTPQYRIGLVGDLLDEGSVVRVEFVQIGGEVVERLSFSVICYNPVALNGREAKLTARHFKRLWSDKFSSTPLRLFADAPTPTRGLIELTVPAVKNDGREWGIRVDYVVRGKPRQEFFLPYS